MTADAPTTEFDPDPAGDAEPGGGQARPDAG